VCNNEHFGEMGCPAPAEAGSGDRSRWRGMRDAGRRRKGNDAYTLGRGEVKD